jgi:TRAP-type mannitol/chloroaromatic compound transport system substrate-binding protein
MQRRKFLKGAGASAAAAAAIAAPTVVGAQPQVRWRLASSFPKALDTIYGASEVFARLVGACTGGRFQVSVHAAGELVPAFGVVDAVQNATVECAHTAPYYFFGKDETFAFACAIPFGLNSRQMTAWMYEGNGLKLMREFYRNYNIHSFPMGNTGAQMGGWYRKEIKSIADMKGLKMRISGFAGVVSKGSACVPQKHPGRRDLSGAGKGHDRCRRMGRALR